MRLIPRYAQALVYFVASRHMKKIWNETLPNLLDEKNKRSELCHGLSSAGKAFHSWFSHETLRECRKACGGLGFSSYAALAQILQGNDIN